MATIFDSSTPDVGSGDLFLTDTGKRIQMQAWAVNTLMAQTSLSDTQTVLGIRQQMPNVAFIS
ncbi:hypothetical protein G3M83_23410, partial [Rouxiella badensis]|uniref:hypothetical protein n=1 Tax=Rouxiella badensis TaxID=1646377 RepID=UPI0013EFD1F7